MFSSVLPGFDAKSEIRSKSYDRKIDWFKHHTLKIQRQKKELKLYVSSIAMIYQLDDVLNYCIQLKVDFGTKNYIITYNFRKYYYMRKKVRLKPYK